jgi:hypothetical protein
VLWLLSTDGWGLQMRWQTSLTGSGLGIHSISHLCKHHHWEIHCERPQKVTAAPTSPTMALKKGCRRMGGRSPEGAAQEKVRCNKRREPPPPRRATQPCPPSSSPSCRPRWCPVAVGHRRSKSGDGARTEGSSPGLSWAHARWRRQCADGTWEWEARGREGSSFWWRLSPA